MADLPIGQNSTPGHLVGEGDGRLSNCFVEKNGDKFYIRRVPGLDLLASVSTGTAPRGMLDVDGAVYSVLSGEVRYITAGLASTNVGSLDGTDGVTLARNNRVTDGVSTPDVCVVRESGGAWLLSTTAVTAYPDVDLPATVNSVCFLGGYFLWTVADGRIFASELNSTDVNALSFATAESASDGLLRGIVSANTFYAMGSATIEPWINVGNTPFPLARATSIIPVGILTTMAVAGLDEGWDRNPFFIASDQTVRELDGFETHTVSTPDVERFVAASTVSTIEMSAYVVDGRAFVSISSDQGTWEYLVGAGTWHERASAGIRWRACRAILSNNRWIFGDQVSTNLLTVSRLTFAEAGAALPMMIESAPVKEFPIRSAIASVFGDFTMGVGTIAIPNPQVLVQWSHDGGRTWSAGVSRSLAPPVGPIRVNRLGLATHHGLRVRFTITDAVDVAFMGGTVNGVEARKP